MEKNMGTLDRLLRVAVAIAIVVLLMKGFIYGMIAVVSIAIGLVLLITALLGFCPLYRMLGITTCKTKDQND